MNKYFKYSILAVVVISAVLLGLKFWGVEKESPVEIETSQVKFGTISTSVTATGTVEPVDQVEVGTQVSGLVQKIYVDYNSPVKKGQLLAELDKTTLNQSVANAQASYTAALNELNYYQLTYNRQKSMYDSGVISKADFEQAAYQIKNAEATVVQRRTALTQAQSNLGYASIYSPIDGVIISKEVEEGQTVAASMSTPTLFTIAKDINKMQVEADVDEADIGEVKEGQRVSFTVDAFPEIEFSGTVRQVRLGATTTSNVVTYTVIIDADNPDKKLKPGLTATINIYTMEVKDIPVIEAQALNFNPDFELLKKYYEQQGIVPPAPDQFTPPAEGQKTVWIKKSSGLLIPRTVETGTSDGVQVEIKSGLSAEDTIVTKLHIDESALAVGGSAGGKSPFMPTPPSRANKKSSQQ